MKSDRTLAQAAALAAELVRLLEADPEPLPRHGEGQPLSDRALRFAEFYRMTGKLALSARMAGYSFSTSPTMASRLIRDPRILAILERPLKEPT